MKPARRRSGPGAGIGVRIAALFLSIAAGLLLAEAAYRGKLLLELMARAGKPTYGVFQESLYEYDPEFGYSYARGRNVFSCDIRDGLVRSCRTISVDGHGNLDTGSAPPKEPTRVLIFGDSFTANPSQILGWPHYFAELTGYEVMNFARDGYGIPQMFRLAAERSRELKPDLIIVTFILEDLWRSRSWRATVERVGGPVTLVSSGPSVADDPEAAELAIVEPEVTPEWCERVRSGTTPGDPILKRLNRRYGDLATRHNRTFLLSFRHSLVLNRIRRGDPFFGMEKPARNPRTSLMDFSGDPQLVADITSIQAPMLLVILPRYDELIHWKLRTSAQGKALLESLRLISGTDPVLLMNLMELDSVDVAQYYLLPEDTHPSAAGSKAFATAIGRLVESFKAEVPTGSGRRAE